MTKILTELKSEIQNIKLEVQTLKTGMQERGTVEKKKCHHCSKVAHIKRDYRKLKRELEQTSKTNKDLNNKAYGREPVGRRRI